MISYFYKTFLIATRIILLHSLRELGYISHSSGKNWIQNYHIDSFEANVPFIYLLKTGKIRKPGLFNVPFPCKWNIRLKWIEITIIVGQSNSEQYWPLNKNLPHNYILNCGFMHLDATWFRIDILHPRIIALIYWQYSSAV